MENFKKPSLPIAAGVKTEKDIEPLKNVKENVEQIEEHANSVKSQSPYKVPKWSQRPSEGTIYSFEVLKSGQIIDDIKELQKKAYWSFGRLPENDIEMAHPTISRFHAVLQYRPKCKAQNSDVEEEHKAEESPPWGWYIYDLGSTHGTFLNKQRVPPKVYIRVRVGHLLRLGASTRSYILQGPNEDEEPESELSVTELKAKRQREHEEAALKRKVLAEETAERISNEGCSWGMAEDADEESDLAHNPYAISNNEEIFLEDPKKTLRGYFEREGMELVYKCDEMSAGSFVCRVELPIDDTNGRSIVAEVVHKGKKKECVLQCALEACRILDRHGVLRQANQEPLKRKQKSPESDSDDDEFWDRTGDVAKKKQRKAAANVSVTVTYEDLLKQENDIDEHIKQVELNISLYQEQQQRIKAQKLSEGEDLDAFMETLQEKEIKVDKTEIRKLRIEEQRLKAEKCKVQKLIKLAKPVEMPFTPHPKEKNSTLIQSEMTIKKQLPMIGKRNQFSKFKFLKSQPTKEATLAKVVNSDEEEVEEEENTCDKEHKEEKETLQNECLLNIDHGNECEIDETAENAKGNKSTIIQTDNETFESKIRTVFCTESNDKNESESSNKKRRHRIRQRCKREEIDINDNEEYESFEKYAKWLPPDNQTGDGLTELNKKFGY